VGVKNIRERKNFWVLTQWFDPLTKKWGSVDPLESEPLYQKYFLHRFRLSHDVFQRCCEVVLRTINDSRFTHWAYINTTLGKIRELSNEVTYANLRNIFKKLVPAHYSPHANVDSLPCFISDIQFLASLVLALGTEQHTRRQSDTYFRNPFFKFHFSNASHYRLLVHHKPLLIATAFHLHEKRCSLSSQLKL
jgi:hypothetical protein